MNAEKNRNLPVWKLTDKEIIAELQKRADQQVTLDALIKLRRMFQISAEKAQDLAPGLHVALGLLDMHAMNYGGAAREIDVTGLLREARSINKDAIVVTVERDFASDTEMPKPRHPGRRSRTRVRDENSKSGRVRAFIVNEFIRGAPGDFTMQSILPNFPGMGYQTVYAAVNQLELDGVLAKTGRGVWKAAA
jgi:hypothetical protein